MTPLAIGSPEKKAAPCGHIICELSSDSESPYGFVIVSEPVLTRGWLGGEGGNVGIKMTMVVTRPREELRGRKLDTQFPSCLYKVLRILTLNHCGLPDVPSAVRSAVCPDLSALLSNIYPMLGMI